MGLACRG
jgi:hypothetical protein